jgi:DNA-binding NarL/FixJ family response regulator
MEILLIEDQLTRFRTVIDILKDEFTINGYKFKEFDRWNKALEYYKTAKDRIALIIIDIRGPKDDNNDHTHAKYDKFTGLNFYKSIIELNQEQPVIFWTILSKNIIESEGYIIDINDHVLKTDNIEILFKKIDRKIGTNIAVKFTDELYD